MSRLLKTSALCGLLCLSSIGIVFGSARYTKKSEQASNALNVNKKERIKTLSRKKSKKSRKDVKNLSADMSLDNIASSADVDSNYWDSTQVISNSGSSQSVEDLNQQFSQLSVGQGQVNVQHSRLHLAQARTSDSNHFSNSSDHHSASIPIRPQLGAVPSFSCDDLLALASGTNQTAHRRSSESSHREPISFQIPENVLHRPIAVGKFKGENVGLKATPYSLAQQPRRGISESTSHFFGGQQAWFPQMQPRFMPPQGDKEPFPTFTPIAINANNNGRKPFPLPEDRRPSRAAYRTVRYHAPSPIPGGSRAMNVIISPRDQPSENADLQLSAYSHATITNEVQMDNNQQKITQLVKNIEEWIEEELDNQAEALRKLVIQCGLEAQEATISETFDCPDEAFDDFRTICHSHKTRESLGFYNYAKQGVDEIMDRVDQQVTKNVLRCLLFNDPQLKGNEQIETQVRGLVDYLAEPVVKKLTRTAFLLAMDVKDDVCECCCGVWHKPKISKETKQQILSGIGSGLKGVASLFVGEDLVQGACDLAGGVFNVIKEVCAAQVE